MKSFLITAITVLSTFFIGCQTPLHKSVNEVQIGMDKSDVIEILGSPKYTKRSNGHDIWKYVFYKNNVKQTKTYHFYKGHITKIGSTKAKPYLLEHAMNAENIEVYEQRVRKYQEAQKELN